MNCKVEKSKVSGHITCPPNKSYSHRAIFLASLAGNNSKIDNVLFSADTMPWKGSMRSPNCGSSRYAGPWKFWLVLQNV